MSGAEDLSLWKSIVLGIIQGITEFFPVSSSGHLVVAQGLFGFKQNNLLFDVLLHLGTLGALFAVFHEDVRKLIRNSADGVRAIFSAKSLSPILSAPSPYRLSAFVWITTFVTGCIGLFIEKPISRLTEFPVAAGVGFLITAAILWLSSRKKHLDRMPQNLGWAFPLAIGLSQAFALFPGVSRSGMTIAVALLFGVKKYEAGRYSFVVAIPIIAMASLYEGRHLFSMEYQQQMGPIMAGVLASFLVGLMAIKGLMALLQRMSLLPFAIYCLIIGIGTLTIFL